MMKATRLITITMVLVLCIVVGLVVASWNVPRYSLADYPTPQLPPRIVVVTWTPDTIVLDDFVIPPLETAVINSPDSISSIESPLFIGSAESGTFPDSADPSDSYQAETPVSVVAESGTINNQNRSAPHSSDDVGVVNLGSSDSALSSFAPQVLGTPSIGPAPTPIPTPTNTPVPPTPTPTPTATPEPTATPAGNYNKCPIDGHNLVMMHSHYDAANDCWYDHTHGPVPSDEFIAFTGQQLSYPWLTGNGAENLPYPNGKHEGYNFSARTTDYMVCADPAFCIDSYEVEWHGMPNNHGMATRFHSFAALLRIGDGFIFYGGWHDCGQKVQLGSEWVTINDSRPQPGGTALKHATFDINQSETWYCTLAVVGFENLLAQQYAPSVSHTTPDNLFEEIDAICTDDAPDCLNRGQDRWISAILIDLNRPWTRWADADNDGIANWSGYTDRYGQRQPDGTCTAAGLDCVPLVIYNVPVGRYDMTTNPTGTEPFTPHPERLNWWNR